jgi:acyl CoA:acetate/3-ketoacid CoA transferase alpha subunit
VISNNAGVDDFGLGTLLHTRQIRKMIASYATCKMFVRQRMYQLTSNSRRRQCSMSTWTICVPDSHAAPGDSDSTA